MHAYVQDQAVAGDEREALPHLGEELVEVITDVRVVLLQGEGEDAQVPECAISRQSVTVRAEISGRVDRG